MNSNIKHLMLWVVLIAVAGMLIFVVKNGQGPKEKELIFSDFLSEVTAKHVAEASIAANDVHGKLTDGSSFHVIIPLNYPDVYKELNGSERQDVDQRHLVGHLALDPPAGLSLHRSCRVLDLHDAADAERR